MIIYTTTLGSEDGRYLQYMKEWCDFVSEDFKRGAIKWLDRWTLVRNPHAPNETALAYTALEGAAIRWVAAGVLPDEDK